VRRVFAALERVREIPDATVKAASFAPRAVNEPSKHLRGKEHAADSGFAFGFLAEVLFALIEVLTLSSLLGVLTGL
jgi:hypothetical protein